MYGNPGRGAGRGVGRGMATQYDPNGAIGSEEDTIERPPAEVPQEQRMTYQGNYTKISPNEKKRQQIQQMAQQEEQAYNTYKQQNTPTRVDYVGTVGGGQLKETDVRRKSQQELSKPQRLERKQRLIASKKSIEQAEIDKRKAEQRKKAEMNELRRKQDEMDDSHKWDDQRRRTNEAFLKRLENQSKKPPPNSRGTSIGTSSSSLPRSSDISTSSQSGSISRRAQSEVNNNSSQTSPLGASAAGVKRSEASGGVTDELQKKVIALQAIFPQYEETELREILTQLNGSLDEAVAVLQD